MKFGFVFPGQGSQSIGMLAELAVGSGQKIVEETFAEASDVIDLDLWRIAQDGPDTQLNDTAITQPTLLAAGVATWRIWRHSGGGVPQLLAGHSLGEYSALVASESLNLAEAIQLVHHRGQLMQSAVPTGAGAMAAILGLAPAEIESACDSADGVVSPANFNAPGQVVIAGETHAVERAIENCKQAGAKRAIPLAVSVPSHCELMRSAAAQLEMQLKEIQLLPPKIAVIQNADVQVFDNPSEIKNALMRQLYRPVRWTETVERMGREGLSALAECGPGKVLAGLNKRIDRSMSCVPLLSLEVIEKTIEEWGHE